MTAIINPRESGKMKKYIIIIIVAVGMFALMQATGCATSQSQPATQAQASEQGGSWTHQNTNQVGVNLGDLASVRPVAPQEQGTDGDAVTLGKPDITPEQMQQAASKAGGSFVYVKTVTVNQSVTGGADAKRAGTVSQTPSNGNTDQTPTNSPTTDVKLDAGGLVPAP